MAGVRECRRRFPLERLVVLWLGSSVGNLSHGQAVQFFKDVLEAGGQNLQVLCCALRAGMVSSAPCRGALKPWLKP